MALVAETVSTAIIGQLVETVLSYANGSWWSSANAVKAEAERLQVVLPQVKAVLCAAQRGKINQREAELEAWMWQFRDAVEEAGDVLDEIEYYKLEQKVRARDNKVSGPFSGCKRKLANFVRNAFVNDGVLKKLREAVKGLEVVAVGVGPFLELVKGLNEEVAVYNFRQTGPLLADVVIGREKEKDMVVEWLTAKLNGNLQEQLSAFVIFGAGGMGKTTLAQLVCNDPKVKEKFEQIVWVCVSDNDNVVDAATVIKMIIEDFRKKKCDLSNLSTLQTTLQEIVATKKILLVLDDVWRDETRAEWEKIVAPLKFGQPGSKILLTTRMESVAHMIAGLMDGKRQNLRLEGLNEKDFITLLFRHAFAGSNPDEYQHLHKIGYQIAKRLWACPLAAKVIGGVLNNSLNFDYWNRIFEEDIPDVKTSKDGIMGILKLSYYHLPSNLQSCFRYCSIFPQDMIIEEKYLVEKWMGSGLILEGGHGKRPEDIAHEYLGQLTAKSFLSKEKERYDAPNDNVYRIHDLLHELARSLSKGECLRITEHAINIPPTTRHLSIKAGNIGNLREKIFYLSKLHTLEITCIGHDLDDSLGLNEILTGMKSLRSLSVYSRAVKKLPNCIGDLLHLRAISFGGQRASKQNLCQIPESFYQLYHLMLFSLRDDIDIEECGLEGMGNLINLRYLEFCCYQDTSIPWVGNLHSLQELNDFCVRREKGYSIAELKHLTELHKLCIHDLHNISNPDEALEANINQKYHLQALSLNWSKGNRDRDELIANNLRPPVNLNELEISGYSGVTSPNWMIDQSLYNLVSITISNCFKLKDLPPLGQIGSLKHLNLNGLLAVKQVGYSLYGSNRACTIFPSLTELEIYNMPEWIEWSGVGNKLLFPRLEMLYINDCPKLTEIPTLPSTLKRLSVSRAALVTLPGLNQLASDGGGVSSASCTLFLSSLYVVECPNVTTLVCLPFLHLFKNNQSLENLSIKYCPSLLHMPVKLLAELKFLSRLTVFDCPNLVACESVQLPRRLKCLSFGSCGDLEPLIFSSLHHLTFLVELRITNCGSIQSLPSGEVFGNLTNLSELSVDTCNELASLGGIEELTVLRSLTIQKCQKLIGISLLQLPLVSENNQAGFARHYLKLDKLQELVIDHSSLLMLDPLRNLRTVRSLRIRDGYQITSLPEQWLLQNRSSLRNLTLHGVSSLQALPSSLGSMHCLQDLTISGARLLSSLPYLPDSLKYLTIRGCQSELKDMCVSENGIYWSKISHIQTVFFESIEDED